MDDRGLDPDLEATSADTGEPADTVPASPPDPQADRRAFMRQMSHDAVWTAGRVAGFASTVRRSVMAAGEAAIINLEPPAEDGPPTVSAAAPAITPVAAPAIEVVVDAHSASTRAPDPVAALTPAQHEFLANGSRATLAANDPAGAPHLSSSMYHWDGATVWLPAGLFTARTEHVDRDPLVSLLIEDATSEAWLALTGVASVVYGNPVADEMMLLLSKYLDGDAAARRWEEMRSGGDPVVIHVRPVRFLWRPA